MTEAKRKESSTDDVRVAAKREGAPKTETPETPTPHDETPRNETPRLETPEEPADAPEERDDTSEVAELVAKKSPGPVVAAPGPPKPKARNFDQTPTVQALTLSLGGGPGSPPASVVSNDEAAAIAAQHNL